MRPDTAALESHYYYALERLGSIVLEHLQELDCATIDRYRVRFGVSSDDFEIKTDGRLSEILGFQEGCRLWMMR